MSALHVILNSGSCGASRRPRVQRRLARPRQIRRADIHPAVRDVHAGHVHAVARRARAFHGIAEADAIQVHRVADEERAEHEHVVTARDCGAPFLLRARAAAARRPRRPRVAERKHVARRVVAEHAGRSRGEIPRTEARRPAGEIAGRRVARLRGVDLRLEGDEALAERRREAARQLEVRSRGIGGLRLQRRRPRVGHHVHAGRQTRLGISHGRQTALGDERADAEVAVRQVLRVRDGPRPAVHRHGRLRRLQAVDGVRVAARGIAHDLEREFDGQRRARGVARRPRRCDPDEAARQEQRMRGRIAGREMRAVAAVDGREQRVLPARRVPALADRRHRQRHGVRGLVTGDAAAAVGAERREKRVVAGIDRAGRIEDAERAGGVRVERFRGQRPAVAGSPPLGCRRQAREPDRCEVASTHPIASRRSTFAFLPLRAARVNRSPRRGTMQPRPGR